MSGPVTPAPQGSPVAPITVTTSYSLGEGQTLYVRDPGGSGVRVQNPGGPGPQISVDLSGSYWAESTSGPGVFGVSVDAAGASPQVSINPVAKVYVHAFTGGAAGVRFLTGGGLANSGLLQVVADAGEGIGVLDQTRAATFTNQTTGSLVVHGRGSAEAVIGTAFNNAGLVRVSVDPSTDGSLAGAVAVVDPKSFVNSGSIQALTTGANSFSAGVAIGAGTTDHRYTNSGSISGDYSIYANANSGVFADVTIVNSGALLGAVLLGGRATITNTGLIAGDITFGAAPAIYQGVGGHLTGAIRLGAASNTVTLGDDNGAVFNAGGDDRLTGGAGDDLFGVQAGRVTVDGGFGRNTLSFAGAGQGITLSLATGKGEGPATLTVSNIQALVGTPLQDHFTGAGADETFTGGLGDDVIDGGNGWNTAVFEAAQANFRVTRNGDGSISVVDLRAGGPDGTDFLQRIQTLSFTDGDMVVGPANGGEAVDIAFVHVLREAAPTTSHIALHNSLVAAAGADPVLSASVVGQIVAAAATTSSVATLAYEFFTGRAPGAPGMDYLVAADGPNPNNLNSAYYQSFNLENRYINFAVNLGKLGAGQAQFSADYGGLSLFEATRKAYATIFGEAPSDTKLHALLDPTLSLGGQTFTRAEYFAFYGGDGPNGLGTKAGMVGYLLAEAVKADLGVYAKSNDAFLTDVALHNAPFAVDIVGKYGDPSFVFHPG